jgi:hypothetical protein
MTTIEHMDNWLDANFVSRLSPREFNALRSAMVAVVAEDEEFWGNQSWWRVYDEAAQR